MCTQLLSPGFTGFSNHKVGELYNYKTFKVRETWLISSQGAPVEGATLWLTSVPRQGQCGHKGSPFRVTKRAQEQEEPLNSSLCFPEWEF